MPIIHAGFIPLVDCAPLVVAKALGFDREHGFELRLHREVSWANIRDKTELGIFDCAHMLAPMPIASTLGLGRAPVAMIAPMALNLNGNAITVSNALYAAMEAADPASARAGGMRSAVALAKVVRDRQARGIAPLTLGMVYPFSCHNYDLRYWLAAAGIHPDEDVRLVVVPPPFVAKVLADGEVDGYCVGAPWGSVSVENGSGHIVATKQELWAGSPEKVLGVRKDWAERNPEMLQRLMLALLTAGAWLDRPENHAEAARILARPEFVGVVEAVIRRPLSGDIVRPGGERKSDPDFIVFHRNGANFPWVSHAIWILTQMQRWGQLSGPIDFDAVARKVYRPDMLRRAAKAYGLPMPASDRKPEAGSFFGGESFDASAASAYLQGFSLRTEPHPYREPEGLEG
jgi:NitT/TauT family transport system ATP-binding protein/nitrate/nitrite transport system substrate-binding protein